MSEYIKFEDLKVGEKYDIYYRDDNEVKYHNPHLCVHKSEKSRRVMFVNSLGIGQELESGKEFSVRFKLHKQKPSVDVAVDNLVLIDKLDELIEGIKNFKDQIDSELEKIDEKILELSKILEPDVE